MAPPAIGDSLTVSEDRRVQLLAELSVALRDTTSVDLQGWGKRTRAQLGESTLRRGRNLDSLISSVARGAAVETWAVVIAARQERTRSHLRARGNAASEAARRGAQALTDLGVQLGTALREQPRDTGTRLAAGVLGFLLGSGGVDGDGGVPDLDFLGGIGAHRSIFTHSIIAGIVIETAVLSLVDLAKTVHINLPAEHDPLWDRLVDGSEDVVASLTAGVSAGIAYHLAVDATLDGAGTYKDLPLSAPQEVHQGILATNAVAEAAGVTVPRACVAKTADGSRLFTTHSDAREFAMRNPGWMLRRDPGGVGYRVSPPKTLTRSPSDN